MKPAQKESGNALFMVLIGVVLFAALTFAVTRSGSGGSTVSREQAALAANEVLDYANTIRMTIQRLKATRGCTDATLDLGSQIANFGSDNPSAPADKSCHLFDPKGGGLKVLTPPAGVTQGVGWMAGYNIDSGMSFTGVAGSDQTRDLYLILYDVSKTFCDAVNSQLHYNWTALPPVIITIGQTGYPWGTTFAGNGWKFNGWDPAFDGKTVFCGRTLNGPPSTFNFFAYALILK